MMDFSPEIQQMLMQQAMSNPRIANNPQAQQVMRILQSGDAKAGEEMARNLCQTYGIDPNQGVAQAQQAFRNQFPQLFGSR